VTPFEWAVVLVLGGILGAMSAWAFMLFGVLVDIRAELRRINTAYQNEIDKIVGRHH
jgi:hypothetical protein